MRKALKKRILLAFKTGKYQAIKKKATYFQTKTLFRNKTSVRKIFLFHFIFSIFRIACPTKIK